MNITVLPSIDVYGGQVSITRLGFGCARLFGGAETRASARLIEAALECGIRHFDTAPSYGDGRSEQVLGEVLRGMTDVTLTSKIGIPRPTRPSGSWRGRLYRRYVRPALATAPGLKRRLLDLAVRRRVVGPSADGLAPSRRRIEPAAVIYELETSLALLRREVLDLYLIHEPDGILIDDELLAAFAALRRQGLIRAFGVALGGEASTWPAGVDVVQSLCPPGGGLAPPLADSPTPIYHGVMRRQSIVSAEPGAVAGPHALVVALRRHPRAGFLFSASTPRQIRELVAVVQGEDALCGF